MRGLLLAALAAAGVATVATTGFAQTTLENPVGEFMHYDADSGVVAGQAGGDDTILAWQHVVRMGDSVTMRLHFGEAWLGKGSWIQMSSVFDGEVQTFTQTDLETWSYASAHFNGSAVLVQLYAAPDTMNRVQITTVERVDGVWLPTGFDCGLCSDARTPSTDPSAFRLWPVGCSGTLYNTESCGVTAGHCVDGGSNVAHFNVPPSQSNCNPVAPPVADQFPITVIAFTNGGVGNDWGVVSMGTNNLGQTPFERYGVFRPITTGNASNGTASDIWGYGIDNQCVRNQAQQFGAGPINGLFGGYYTFAIDATFGNSGSGLVRNSDNTVVGVVTHCSTSCSPQQNVATRTSNSAFANAINTCSPPDPLPNDDCTDALPISDGATAYSTVGAGTDGPSHASCEFDGQTYNDIWYTYISPCDGPLTVSTCSSANYDTDLVVYNGCNCGNLNLLGCNDDTEGCAGFTSEVTVNVVEGGCYLIRVGGWMDGDQGDGTLNVTGPDPDPCQGPATGACCLQDGNCVDDLEATACAGLGGIYQGDDSLCSQVNCPEPTGACCLNATSCVDDVTATQCAGFGGTYQGDGSDCSQVVCADPGGACCLLDGNCVDGVTSAECAVAGGTFQGDGSDCSTVVCPQPGPENDLCGDALPAGAGVTAFDTTGAGTDGPAHPDDCEFDGQTYQDIWYTHVADCDGTLTVSTCNDAGYDTDLVVYDGCDCANLQLLGCNDDGAGLADFSSFLEVPVSAGNCYLVRVGGWNPGDEGTGNLTIACTPDEDCPGDFNGDGSVGVPDLLLLFGFWGTPAGDLTGDGLTGVPDLLALFGLWGPCP